MHIVKLVFIENKKTDAITNSIILKPSLHVVLEKSGFIELISLVLANIKMKADNTSIYYKFLF